MNATFGTVLADQLSLASWRDGAWSDACLEPVGPLPLHPATHALHYGSSCFEGLKAHRGADGVAIFRLDRHVARLRSSAAALCLPVPPAELLKRMVIDVVRASLDRVPDPPGSLYLRPTLIGTETNIGAATQASDEALLYVLAGPVGSYFAGPARALVVAIETERARSTSHFGSVKTGANYAMALGPTLEAKRTLGADQVLFAPEGVIQETGASNFLVIDHDTLITPERDGAVLSGVTLDALLTLGVDLGYAVEERTLTVDEVLSLAAHPDCEAALSGTAAILTGVGTLIHDGARVSVGAGTTGPHTTRLLGALTDIYTGRAADRHGWLTAVHP